MQQIPLKVVPIPPDRFDGALCWLESRYWLRRWAIMSKSLFNAERWLGFYRERRISALMSEGRPSDKGGICAATWSSTLIL